MNRIGSAIIRRARAVSLILVVFVWIAPAAPAAPITIPLTSTGDAGRSFYWHFPLYYGPNDGVNARYFTDPNSISIFMGFFSFEGMQPRQTTTDIVTQIITNQPFDVKLGPDLDLMRWQGVQEIELPEIVGLEVSGVLNGTISEQYGGSLPNLLATVQSIRPIYGWEYQAYHVTINPDLPSLVPFDRVVPYLAPFPMRPDRTGIKVELVPEPSVLALLGLVLTILCLRIGVACWRSRTVEV